MDEKKCSVRDAWARYKQNPELEKDTLISALNALKDAWKREREPHERGWRNNVAFYKGDHYVRRPVGSTADFRVRIRENHTNNIINRQIAIITQNPPITRVFPESDQWEDEQKADTCEKFLKYQHRRDKMELKLVKNTKFACTFGNAFAWWGYDPYAGGEVHLDASETKSGDPETRHYRGDVKVEIFDPFKILVRPGIDEWDDMYDCIRSVAANRDEFEAIYGKIEGEEIKAKNAYTASVRHDPDMLLVNHYYHIPTNWFEEGLYVCWSGSTIMKAISWPYRARKLPGDHLHFDKPAMSFWAMATIDNLIDLQEQLNRASSMIVEARNLVARPRVLAANQANVPAQSLTDRPGEILRWDASKGAPPPQFIVSNFNFAEMSAHKNDLRNQMGSVSGVTAVSRGEIPPSITTAFGLQLAIEQDRSQFSTFIRQMNYSMLEIGKGVLDVAAEYFPQDDPRLIKIEGNTGYSSFHGRMVPSELDCYLEDTNKLGWTASGRIEQSIKLAEAGIIQDKNQILEMIDLPSTDPAFEYTRINRRAQQKEILELEKGILVPIGPEDNDDIHLRELLKVIGDNVAFRKKPKPVQDAFLDHAKQHKDRIAMAAQQMTGAQAQAQGKPPQGSLEGLQGSAAPVDPSQMDQLVSQAPGAA